jgi:thiamine transport system ATP-binding protein
MLEVAGLTVQYPGTDAPALADLDLEVGDGEVVAVLGPSGCGKSTLLRAVAGLVPPTAGRIELAGRDLAPVPTHQRGIGLMFQDYALFPHRDVAGNVGFGLRMRGDAAAERDRRVAEVLELVGLGDYGGRAVSTLSGGERQRVALARALAPAPRLLMLDEPLGALDRSLRDELVVELSGLFARLGLSVVYVTHDQTEALALADRVVILDRGRRARQGRPRAVWERPGSAFVARFLGFTNLIDVQVDEGPAGEGDLGAAVTVHAPWGDLRTIAPASPAPGLGPATLLVRSDAVTLVEPGQPDGLPATVLGLVFRGDRSVVRLALVDGTVLDADLAAGAVAARLLDVGTTVAVAIDPGGTQLLPPEVT